MTPAAFSLGSLSTTQLFSELETSTAGLSPEAAMARLRLQRQHTRRQRPWMEDARLLLSQFTSPLVLLLLGALVLSTILGEVADGFIVGGVLVATGLLGFIQERRAGQAVKKLQAMVHITVTVRRGGVQRSIPLDDVVPGDILLVKAGDLIAADGILLHAKDLHVNESPLTGESFPVEKFAVRDELRPSSPAATTVFKGTSVLSGTATVLAVRTGADTELGSMATSLTQAAGPTAFEQEMIRFGYLLMRIAVIFTLVILVVNWLVHHVFWQSLMFSLALTVGLTPELLPAILTITLSFGARRMAARNVVVKKLEAIQNLGEMDVLCSDKTGTLTQGQMTLQDTLDAEGRHSQTVSELAYLNSFFETGFVNPIDEAIRKSASCDVSVYRKIDEVPYDFTRKRLTVLVGQRDTHQLITKGAVPNVLEVCTQVRWADTVCPLESYLPDIESRYAALSQQGFRVIAVACRELGSETVPTAADERELVFQGFLVFSDPLKGDAPQAIARLRAAGIRLKMITGDHRLVAVHLGEALGLRTGAILTGGEVAVLSPPVLAERCESIDIFAEIVPTQKESIVRALQRNGHSVGYVGDGINDAGALHAADVGISIYNAVDVAREAADIVLLDQQLDVILAGVQEGRRTFQNSLKYLLLTLSANFGNMFSMAVASLFLPFLPLLPIQILLNNFLSDIPAMALATDRVDEERLRVPKRWQFSELFRFMLVFGLQSSLFDFALFGGLLYLFHASPAQFQSAWFVESLLTEILVLLIIRTRRAVWASRPSRALLGAVSFSFVTCLGLVYLPGMEVVGLDPLPIRLLGWLLLVVLLYAVTAEGVKPFLFKRNE